VIGPSQQPILIAEAVVGILELPGRLVRYIYEIVTAHLPYTEAFKDGLALPLLHIEALHIYITKTIFKSRVRVDFRRAFLSLD